MEYKDQSYLSMKQTKIQTSFVDKSFAQSKLMNIETGQFLHLIKSNLCKFCEKICHPPLRCKQCQQFMICSACSSRLENNQCQNCHQEFESEDDPKDVYENLKKIEKQGNQIKKVIYSKYRSSIAWDQFKKIKISNFRPIKDSMYTREYIVYKIEINDQILLERRYNDFLALHQHLIRQYQGHIFPVLPPKHSLENSVKQMVGDYGYTHSFLNQRREQLEMYLQLVYENKNFKDDIVLEEFLTKHRFQHPEDSQYQSYVNTLLGSIQNINDTFQFGMAYLSVKLENPVLRYSDITPVNIRRINQISSSVFGLQKILTGEQENLDLINFQLSRHSPQEIFFGIDADIDYLQNYLNNLKEIRVLNQILLKKNLVLCKRIEGLQFATQTIIVNYDDISARSIIREKKRLQGLYEEEAQLLMTINILTQNLRNMTTKLEEDSGKLIQIIKVEFKEIIKQYKLYKLWEEFIQHRQNNFLDTTQIIKDYEEREKNYYLRDLKYEEFEELDEDHLIVTQEKFMEEFQQIDKNNNTSFYQDCLEFHNSLSQCEKKFQDQKNQEDDQDQDINQNNNIKEFEKTQHQQQYEDEDEKEENKDQDQIQNFSYQQQQQQQNYQQKQADDYNSSHLQKQQFQQQHSLNKSYEDSEIIRSVVQQQQQSNFQYSSNDHNSSSNTSSNQNSFQQQQQQHQKQENLSNNNISSSQYSSSQKQQESIQESISHYEEAESSHINSSQSQSQSQQQFQQQQQKQQQQSQLPSPSQKSELLSSQYYPQQSSEIISQQSNQQQSNNIIASSSYQNSQQQFQSSSGNQFQQSQFSSPKSPQPYSPIGSQKQSKQQQYMKHLSSESSKSHSPTIYQKPPQIQIQQQIEQESEPYSQKFDSCYSQDFKSNDTVQEEKPQQSVQSVYSSQTSQQSQQQQHKQQQIQQQQQSSSSQSLQLSQKQQSDQQQQFQASQSQSNKISDQSQYERDQVFKAFDNYQQQQIQQQNQISDQEQDQQQIEQQQQQQLPQIQQQEINLDDMFQDLIKNKTNQKENNQDSTLDQKYNLKKQQQLEDTPQGIDIPSQPPKIKGLIQEMAKSLDKQYTEYKRNTPPKLDPSLNQVQKAPEQFQAPQQQKQQIEQIQEQKKVEDLLFQPPSLYQQQQNSRKEQQQQNQNLIMNDELLFKSVDFQNPQNYSKPEQKIIQDHQSQISQDQQKSPQNLPQYPLIFTDKNEQKQQEKNQQDELDQLLKQQQNQQNQLILNQQKSVNIDLELDLERDESVTVSDSNLIHNLMIQNINLKSNTGTNDIVKEEDEDLYDLEHQSQQLQKQQSYQHQPQQQIIQQQSHQKLNKQTTNSDNTYTNQNKNKELFQQKEDLKGKEEQKQTFTISQLFEKDFPSQPPQQQQQPNNSYHQQGSQQSIFGNSQHSQQQNITNQQNIEQQKQSSFYNSQTSQKSTNSNPYPFMQQQQLQQNTNLFSYSTGGNQQNNNNLQNMFHSQNDKNQNYPTSSADNKNLQQNLMDSIKNDYFQTSIHSSSINNSQQQQQSQSSQNLQSLLNQQLLQQSQQQENFHNNDDLLLESQYEQNQQNESNPFAQQQQNIPQIQPPQSLHSFTSSQKQKFEYQNQEQNQDDDNDDEIQSEQQVQQEIQQQQQGKQQLQQEEDLDDDMFYDVQEEFKSSTNKSNKNIRSNSNIEIDENNNNKQIIQENQQQEYPEILQKINSVDWDILEIQKVSAQECFDKFFSDHQFEWSYNQQVYPNFLYFLMQEIHNFTEINISQIQEQQMQQQNNIKQRNIQFCYNLNSIKYAINIQQNFYWISQEELVIENVHFYNGLFIKGNLLNSYYHIKQGQQQSENLSIKYGKQVILDKININSNIKEKLCQQIELEDSKNWQNMKNQIVNIIQLEQQKQNNNQNQQNIEYSQVNYNNLSIID